jgi:predicted nuclease of predicted toxin-antitoxin system
VIRLLLDQGLPRSTVRHLAERGIDACHVADIGSSHAADHEIVELAQGQGQVIVINSCKSIRILRRSVYNVMRIRHPKETPNKPCRVLYRLKN